jgi:hypothetical protein
MTGEGEEEGLYTSDESGTHSLRLIDTQKARRDAEPLFQAGRTLQTTTTTWMMVMGEFGGSGVFEVGQARTRAH